ncbi:winged helix DNA-binding domain-containing protein [Glutamicibacter sp. 0426]|uniref:winged helix DNA-binding domain-containing protein n=1 Tax=Glutamicibacter sp. 0426 TaxID=1913445 RepID=UPI0009FAB432|nr:winged helix DNA-binding domain-containing protein [Glutamicibacter sp. 0426]
MDRTRVLAARMASQLLLEPAESTLQASEHMLAFQSQDFAAGRYGLAQRSAAQESRQQVDALFAEGQLVRSWTMRGTLHICVAEDARWLVRASRERTMRSAAARLRGLQIDAQVIDQAAGVISSHLQESGQACRTGLFNVLNRHGIETDKQRGLHLLQVLALDGLICLGPTPDGAKLTAQDFVLVDERIAQHREPADPLAEILRRYLSSHGPATIRDAAWYAGQTLSAMRTAAQALDDVLVSAGNDERGENYWVIAGSLAHRELETPQSTRLPLRLLGPFDEYYLGYADRALAADEQMAQQILPGKNGMFLPFWLEQGRAARLWNAEAAPTDRLGAALHQRYLDFKTAR